MTEHRHDTHPEIVKRLRRAEGHLKSVISMIEGGRPCLDIAQQLQAVEKAITNAKRTLIQDHLDHCLDDAVGHLGGDQRRSIDEFKTITNPLTDRRVVPAIGVGQRQRYELAMWTKVLDCFGFGSHGHSHDPHGHDHHGPHGHTHGVIDATIATTDRGIWAIKWSFVILAATAAMQIVVVALSGSVALLADTIHNVADATTAIPLWIAFVLAWRKPTKTFTYGLGRVEDLAGIIIVMIILFNALVAGYQAINRLINPEPISHLGWLIAAGVIGFIGNEAVAVFRIRVGREISSAALIADGLHARTDGLTSLAVVAGAIGVWLWFPIADPIVGMLITVAIFGIVWQSARACRRPCQRHRQGQRGEGPLGGPQASCRCCGGHRRERSACGGQRHYCQAARRTLRPHSGACRRDREDRRTRITRTPSCP